MIKSNPVNISSASLLEKICVFAGKQNRSCVVQVDGKKTLLKYCS